MFQGAVGNVCDRMLLRADSGCVALVFAQPLSARSSMREEGTAPEGTAPEHGLITGMKVPLPSTSKNTWLSLQRRTVGRTRWITDYFGKDFCLSEIPGVGGRPQMGERGVVLLEPLAGRREKKSETCLRESPEALALLVSLPEDKRWEVLWCPTRCYTNA